MKPDITTQEDIRSLVDAFYARFTGPNAEEVKERAGDIARAFQMRLGLVPFPAF